VRVTVATTNADGNGVLDVPIDQLTEYEGVDARFFNRRGEAFKYSPALARWLRRAVREFDVVHVHAVFSHASLAAGRACQSAGVPYVVRPLGSLDPWSLAQHAWRKRVLMWSAVGSLLRGASGLHFTTEGERDAAAEVSGEVPSRVIPLGVDDQYLSTPPIAPADRDRRIVVLARFDRKKNLDRLIRAFHASAPDAEGWRLTIAGAGDAAYEAEMRQAAGGGPAAARIDIEPWLDGEKKLELLRRAAVFATPSFQENFGLAALEAMACGVPVLAAANVNLAPAIRQAGAGWVTGTSEAELTAALKQIMRDEVGLRRRATNARKLAGNYTWSSAAAQLEQWYENLAPTVAARQER